MTALALERRVVDYDPLIGKPYAHTGLGEPLANYLASKKSNGRAAKTLRDKEEYVGSLARMFPSKTVDQFTPFDILHWEVENSVGASSRRTRRSHIHDFFAWAVKWDLITKNPAAKLDPVTIKRAKVFDTFDDAEYQALCGLPVIDGALCSIMLKAGLRKGECCKLQVQDILPSGQIRVLAGKGDKDRLVGMTSSLAAIVNELITVEGLNRSDHLWYSRVNQGRSIKRNRPLGDGSFYRWWERVLAGARVRGRNPHMTRHTFATRWIQRGGRLETLSPTMGHSSIAITYDLYAHLRQEDIRADLLLMED